MLARLEDRKILERVIFPYFSAHGEIHDILCVGCAWNTAHYPGVFRDRNFRTLDIDPGRRRHGAAQHVTDGMENVARHFGAESLDQALCNGVFGWGPDTEAQLEGAFGGSFECLRPEGLR